MEDSDRVDDSDFKSTAINMVEDSDRVDDSDLKSTTINMVEDSDRVEVSNLKSTAINMVEDSDRVDDSNLKSTAINNHKNAGCTGTDNIGMCDTEKQNQSNQDPCQKNRNSPYEFSKHLYQIDPTSPQIPFDNIIFPVSRLFSFLNTNLRCKHCQYDAIHRKK